MLPGLVGQLLAEDPAVLNVSGSEAVAEAWRLSLDLGGPQIGVVFSSTVDQNTYFTTLIILLLLQLANKNTFESQRQRGNAAFGEKQNTKLYSEHFGKITNHMARTRQHRVKNCKQIA